MFEVVLYQPEIPPNTGNVIRLCANTGCRLHLVEPLGFRMDDRELKRAGLDYHEYATVQLHQELAGLPCRRWASGACSPSRRAARSATIESLSRPAMRSCSAPETRGLPPELLEEFPAECRLRLPMRSGQRSLNLSNAVAVVVFEAWRQIGFAGAG